jgi:hypothetical protein
MRRGRQFLVAPGAAVFALAATGCDVQYTPDRRDKIMEGCVRMAVEAHVGANCTCLVSDLGGRLSDGELNDLCDALNQIADQANGNSEIARREIETRVTNGSLVSAKVGTDYATAMKACPPFEDDSATPVPGPQAVPAQAP